MFKYGLTIEESLPFALVIMLLLSKTEYDKMEYPLLYLDLLVFYLETKTKLNDHKSLVDNNATL